MSAITDAKHLFIRGRVQGVGFRESMRYKAEEIDLVGWVRNCRDGSVEAVIAGDAASVQRMIAWAHRGPPAAQVERVEVEDWPVSAAADFTDFRRAPSA